MRSHLLPRSFSRPVSAEITQNCPKLIELLKRLRAAELTGDIDWIVQFSEHSPVLYYNHDAALIEQAFSQRLTEHERQKEKIH